MSHPLPIRPFLSALLLLGAVALGHTAEPPSVQLATDTLKATVYTPDPEIGFYRGPRFDWSGMVSSLEFDGHRFFFATRPPPNPKATDNVVGTAGEFGMETPLGFDDAAKGGTFYKIGVGRLTRPDDKPYFFANRYPVDPLPWTVEHGTNWVEFSQDLPTEQGWGYHLNKRIELDPEKPVMTIRYTLKNTGTKPLNTNHYCHNFVVIDDRAPDQGTRMLLDFEPTDTTPLKAEAVVEGKTISFIAPIPKGKALHRAFENLKAGEGLSAAVEDSRAGAGIRITSDTQTEKVVFYGLGKTVSFEPFVPISLAPGESKTWSATYEPYVMTTEKP